MKYALEHCLAFLMSFLSGSSHAFTRLLLWRELRNNHGQVAIMLFYCPEIAEHSAAERGFTSLQRKFEARSEARFMRFVFKYNQPFCQRLGVRATDLPVVVCEWSRLIRATDQSTAHRSLPMAAGEEQILENHISQFLGLATELAKRRAA